MKSLIATLAAMLVLPLSLLAQLSISGKVTDAQEDQALPGANVLLKNSFKAASTNAEGSFTFSNLKSGNYTLQVSFVGYQTQQIEVVLDNKDKVIRIALPKSTVMTEEVLVSATRATEKSGLAFTNVSREELEKQNLGQDIPYLLNFTPSIVTTSDAGAGIGYTGMRVRGSDASRINVTVNGIPLNDAESHGVFWVNMPDFASSVDNIQIQRGVGTSTNGAGAFGASVNIQTTTLEKEAYGEVINSIGSFNTRRHTARVGTGLLNNRWAIDARLSKISSDGYIDRASSDLKSFFASAGYYGDKSILKFNVFSGKERTYQAWEGVPEDSLATNRTYNPYTYENQVDDYQQDHYQMIYSTELLPALNLNAALHYTKGRGFYEQYRPRDKFSGYGLPNVVIGDETISRIALIRRRWLDNNFYGATYALNYTEGKLNTTLGGGINRYDGDHFGEVIWAQFASTGNIRHRYYDNKGVKDDFNIFSKTYYQLSNKLNAYVDLQFRAIDFNVAGIDNNRRDVALEREFRFFNPKFGLNYQINSSSNAYVSYSEANREPTRRNFTDAPQNKLPTSENLKDIEAGYRKQFGIAAFGINYYLMNYKNQVIMTGELNDVGSPIMVNVPSSYRTGIELEAGLKLSDLINWNGNATFSRNKIAAYEEITSIYDADWAPMRDTIIRHTNTDISFSPNIIAASSFAVTPVKGLELALLSKFVGAQYMDNTSNTNRRLDSYFTNDIRINYAFPLPYIKEANVSLLLNNIFNELYESNGYTYTTLFAEGDSVMPVTSNFYYPQAGFNFMLSLGLKF
jgi:iron complex outermembrane receptor protein